VRTPISKEIFVSNRFGRLSMPMAATSALAVIGIAGAAMMRQSGADTPLSNGHMLISSTAAVEIGSFPTTLAISPDGKWIAVSDAGKWQYVSILRASDGRVISQLPFNAKGESIYYGLAFGHESGGATPLYVSRGPEDKISVCSVDSAGQITLTDRSIADPAPPSSAKKKPVNFIAGLALNSTGSVLYSVHNTTNVQTDFKGSVSVIDVASGRVLSTVQTPGYPYAIAAITSGLESDHKVYVSSERDGVVSVLNVADPAHATLSTDITTGDHPDALLLNRSQDRLYVANASSDTISIIDTHTDKVIDSVLLRPTEVRGLPGATPTGLALSPDEQRLYVTLADMNALAVVDLKGRAKLAGFVPTGWYPTSVMASGDHLFVANAKGSVTRHPNGKPAGPGGAWGQYILDIIPGTVADMPVPTDAQLAQSTTEVLAADHISPAVHATSRGLLPRTGITHVIYILKENRTYDQVLGDVSQGNGDKSLVMFGKDVTPNLHALAERFALLDNYYCCAEVSADGWNWSTSGMTSEFGQRNVVFNYSGRGGDYNFEGENAGTPVDLLGIPDVGTAPGGYLWDDCAKHNVSYRGYGFFVTFGKALAKDGSTIAEANMPDKKALVGHTDTDFLRFDTAYADSDAWVTYNTPSPKQMRSFGAHAAPSRFAEWKREFDQCVANHNLPAFSMVRFMRDHTAGTSPGENSPRAMVADNDYAVGQLVEAVSKSPYWNSTAIFVLEDDAQDGYDHIDAHRSTCYVISPYVRRSVVDHRFYNTDSSLRTMEALLGLPAMCQFDAAAPVLDIFESRPVNPEPYTAILPDRAIISEVNDKTAYRAADSAKLNFAEADRVPEGILNDILWHSTHGSAPAPAVRHTLPQRAITRRDDDD
jgi:YVTN family beta-propeller protein